MRTLTSRMEWRDSASLVVELSSVEQPLVSEFASTENVSSHGARVATKRPWSQGTRVQVKSLRGDLWALTQVVYCQQETPEKYAIGLEFLAQTREQVPGK